LARGGISRIFRRFLPFQWQWPGNPPFNYVNSAASHVLAAVQFSGCIAIYAATAKTNESVDVPELAPVTNLPKIRLSI